VTPCDRDHQWRAEHPQSMISEYVVRPLFHPDSNPFYQVKLCYICREEERYDDDTPISPPRAWTHPCKCTLVAHEKCLLKWIQTSQSTLVRAANALKCPQCGAEYQLESKYPVLLKFMSAGNRTLQQLGRLFTLFGVASFICVVGSGPWSLHSYSGSYPRCPQVYTSYALRMEHGH